MRQFQIGDRVVCVGHKCLTSKYHVGATGTVKSVKNGAVGVEFDEPILRDGGAQMGHSLSGKIKSSQGWYCGPQDLDIVVDMSCSVDDLL